MMSYNLCINKFLALYKNAKVKLSSQTLVVINTPGSWNEVKKWEHTKKAAIC